MAVPKTLCVVPASGCQTVRQLKERPDFTVVAHQYIDLSPIGSVPDFTNLSVPPEAIHCPSGLKATAENFAAVTRQGLQLASSGCIPDLDLLVGAAGDDRFAIRAKGDGIDLGACYGDPSVPSVVFQSLTVLSLPPETSHFPSGLNATELTPPP